LLPATSPTTHDLPEATVGPKYRQHGDCTAAARESGKLMLLASWWAPVVGGAAGITAVGTALTFLVRSGRLAFGWWKPRPPLVAFGHPRENPFPFFAWLETSDAEWQRQMREQEAARLKSLTISYLIENKGTTAFREMSTGIRSSDGSQSHTHVACFVQILAPGETVEIGDLSPPDEMWEGMIDEHRAANFFFWARFLDDRDRRWEATYDPHARQTSYRILRRAGRA
jgi:hypothetical protein